MSKVLMARQPILDRNRGLFGYELLYRTDEANKDWDGDLATVEVLINAFLNIGIDQLAGNYPVFVNFTEKLLTEKHISHFAPKEIIIEILEDIELTEPVIKCVKKLSNMGYQLALDDVTPELYTRWAEADMIKHLKFIKVDFLMNKDFHTRTQLVKMIKDKYPGISLIAEKIESVEAFDEALDAGYHLFQGYFFMKPILLESFEIPAYYLTYIQLIKEIDQFDFELLTFAKKIQEDLSLSYKLLKLINSAAYRRVEKVNSIEKAVVLLGQKEIKKWLYILALRDSITDPKLRGADALVKSSYYRAKMCENLAMNINPSLSSEAFLVGYFSQLSSLLRQPLDKLLVALSLDETIEDALLGKPGPLADMLDLAVSYEWVDWSRIDKLADKLKLSRDEVDIAYRDANIWLRSLFE